MDLVRRLVEGENGLCTVFTESSRKPGLASVVNAGLMDHPVSGEPVIATVFRGNAIKLENLRRYGRMTVVFRVRWEWVAIEGATELCGPDDPMEGFDPAGIPQLLRDVFVSAGGTHDDWDEYDRVMAEERRTAVFVAMERVYSNQGTISS